MSAAPDQLILGRQAERQTLQHLLEQARAGRGAVALVTGEAGIGKSTLAEAFARDAEARAFTLIRGRAWEFAEAPPYFPLWPCMRALGLDPDAAGELSAGFRFWERVADALARHSAAQPVAWVLEDLHAADQQTLELLCFLAQPARALRVVLLLTARRADPRLGEHALRLLLRTARDGVDLELSPLPADQALELAQRTTSHALGPDAQARLLERTGGNPLFIIEYAKALRGQGEKPQLPASVRELVLDLRDRLPEPARRMLPAGAVLGREFSASVVATMHAALPARVIDALAPALRAGLLIELAPGRFRFHHDLTREAIYRDCPEQQRIALHAQAEEALRAAHDDAALLAERAHHALCAVVPGREAQAFALAERAAAMAEAQGAFDRAWTLTQRAHELRHALPGVPAASCTELLALAALARRAGLTAQARAACKAAMQRARSAGDRADYARAALQLGADLQPAVVDRELCAALQDALTGLAGATDAAERALCCTLSARLAAAQQPAPDPAGPLAMARAAIEEALEIGDERLIVEVLFYAGSALADIAPLPERLRTSHALLQRASALGDRWRVLTAYARILMDEVETGDFASFDRHLQELLALAREVGHPRLTWRPLLFSSLRALARGDFIASERAFVEVERLAGVTDDRAVIMSLAAHQHHRACMTYGIDVPLLGIGHIAEHMADVPGWELIWRLLDAFAFAFIDDRPRASALLAQIRIDDSLNVDVTFLHYAAEAVAVVGTPEQARFLLKALQRATAPEFPGGHVPISYDGPVARVRGLLHAVMGDHESAERELRDALARTRRNGFTPWVARIQFELGRVLEAAGRGPEAEALWNEAHREAASVGLRGLMALIERARVGAEPSPAPAVSSAPSASPELALAREGELWILSLEGRSVRVRDSRGMQLLARLIERPCDEIHVLALCSDEAGALADSDAGEILDAQAAAAYRKRIADLDAALQRETGSARSARLQEERNQLQRQLAQAFGTQGARRAGSTSERARVNVQRRLKDAIKRVADADLDLGAYLARAIRTGTYCSFRP